MAEPVAEQVGSTGNGQNGRNGQNGNGHNGAGSALRLIPKTDTPQKAKDFKTGDEVRWCPGCGDYAILAAVQGFLPELGLRRENIVFVSGIGCSSRFPYYLDTYRLHSMHGRAPSISTGSSTAGRGQ